MQAAPNMTLQLSPDYRAVLNYATQTVTATIVNAKAGYLIKNVRRLFKNNGLEGTGVELPWDGTITFKDLDVHGGRQHDANSGFPGLSGRHWPRTGIGGTDS